MNEPSIRYEPLPPMRVASVRVVSRTPERDAWRKLRVWAEGKGLLADPAAHPVFGFNHPAPVRGRGDYGYEFWIRVGPDIQSEGEIVVKDFPGGLFAVATCRLLGDPAGELGDVWTRLWESTQTGSYRWRRGHELERPHDPLASEDDLTLDLLLPVQLREEPLPVTLQLKPIR